MTHVRDLKMRNQSDLSGEEMFVAFGTPRLMVRTKSAALSSETRENILLISRSAEQACAASILLSAAKSYLLQGGQVEIWAYSKNRLYRAYKQVFASAGIHVVEDLDAVCDAISKLKTAITNKETANKLIVLIGIERICMDFDYVDSKSKPDKGSSKPAITDVRKSFEASGAVVSSDEDERRQKYGQAWALKRIKLKREAKAAGKTEEEIKAFLAEEETKFREEYGADFETETPEPTPKAQEPLAPVSAPMSGEKTSSAYNAQEDLVYVIKQGSRLGYNKLGTVCQEKAHIYLKKAVTLYEKIEQSWSTEAFRLLTGRAIMELGEYNAKKKQYEKAETYYQQAEDKISKLAHETDSREAKALLSILLRERAELSAERNEHTRAQEFFKSSCRMLESQVKRAKNEPVKIRALRAFFCAGQANKSKERHELPNAKTQYLKALGYYTDEMIRNGDRECRMLYMLLWSELADCFQQTDELQEAVSAYTQSLHTGGLLIAEEADIDLAENVADDAYNLGKLHWKLNQRAAARDAFLLQRRYALKSIEMSGNDEALRGNRFRLQFALRWLMTLDDNTDSRQTLAVYQEAWDNAALLAKEKDTDGLCKDRINILKKLKAIYQENNDCSALRTLYTDAYTLANVLIEQGETPKRQNERAYILKELSAIHQAEGNASMAEACCCDAQRLYKASAQALRTFESYDEWMVSSIALGNIYRRRGAYEAARPYYEEAVRVGESMERAASKEKTKRQLVFAKKCLQGMN